MTLSKEQMEIRRLGVTGSEIAAVAGLNKWRSPGDVWAQKIGIVGPQEPSLAMQEGTLLEPWILSKTEERIGYKIDRDVGTIIHPGRPWIIATPDGLIKEKDEKLAAVEVKRVGFRSADDWADPIEDPQGIPLYYLPQVVWEMAVLQVKQAFVSAYISSSHLWIYQLHWDADTDILFEKLSEKAEAFMGFVRDKQPPPLDDSLATASWIKEYYSTQDKPDLIQVEMQDELELRQAAQEYKQAQEAEKQAQDIKKKAAAKLQAAIKGAAGVQGNGWRATWKQAKSGGTDWKGLAMSLNPSDDLLSQYSKPGSRRFLLSFDK